MLYRHLGYESGAELWRRPITVGTKWHTFRHIASTGDGVIFAVTQEGSLLRYEHRTWNNPPIHGASREQDLAAQIWNAPEKVGTGWQNYRAILTNQIVPNSGPR